MDELDLSRLIQQAKLFFKQRDRTSHEVRSFFVSKGYGQEIVEKLVEYAKEIGLVNDEKFIQNFIEIQMKKGFGKLIISEKLKKFGFSEKEIFDKLKLVSNSEWIEVCEQQIRCSRKSFIKIFQNLISRGFEIEEIKTAFQNLNIPILRDDFYESV